MLFCHTTLPGEGECGELTKIFNPAIHFMCLFQQEFVRLLMWMLLLLCLNVTCFTLYSYWTLVVTFDYHHILFLGSDTACRRVFIGPLLKVLLQPVGVLNFMVSEIIIPQLSSLYLYVYLWFT